VRVQNFMVTYVSELYYTVIRCELSLCDVVSVYCVVGAVEMPAAVRVGQAIPCLSS